MSTRFRLGKGFTIGRSGLRYGRSIPGVKNSYVSVGKSGTLIAGYGVRHWEPGRHRAVGGGIQRCWGFTKAGDQCANSATIGLTCRRHQDQADAAALRRDEFLAANPPPPPSRWRSAWMVVALIVFVACVGGLFALMGSANASYCAKNPTDHQICP